MSDLSCPNKRRRAQDHNIDDETSSIKKNFQKKKDQSIHLLELHNISFQEIFGLLDFISLRTITRVCKYFSNVVTFSDVLILQRIYASVKDIKINIKDDDYDVGEWNDTIMPSFDPLIFNHMPIFSQTPLFHLYSRLLSYNWTLHLLLMARSYNRIGAHQLIYYHDGSDDDDHTEFEYNTANCNKLNLFTIFETNNNTTTANNNVRLKYFRKRRLHSNELELFQDATNHNEWFRIKTLLESQKNIDIKFKDEHDHDNINATVNSKSNNNSTMNSVGDDETIASEKSDVVCINDCQTFLSLLNQRFHYQKWKLILQNKNQKRKKKMKSDCTCCGYEKLYNLDEDDYSDSFGNWFLAGGSVLYCIMKNAREEAGIKDLDFFAVHMYEYQFWQNIFKIARFFQSNGYDAFFINNPKNGYNKLIVIDLYVNFCGKKSRIDKNRLPQYDEEDGFGIYSDHEFVGGKVNGEIVEKYESHIWSKFQFIYNGQWNCPSTILSILFDLDCCQVGFDGNKVLCSYAFIQSITTHTMIYYKLRNNTSERDLYIGRIKKYYQRGFDWLIPVKLSTTIFFMQHNLFINK